jgi:hypothetical protein
LKKILQAQGISTRSALAQSREIGKHDAVSSFLGMGKPQPMTEFVKEDDVEKIFFAFTRKFYPVTIEYYGISTRIVATEKTIVDPTLTTHRDRFRDVKGTHRSVPVAQVKGQTSRFAPNPDGALKSVEILGTESDPHTDRVVSLTRATGGRGRRERRPR